MSFEQAAIVVLLVGMLVIFALDRFRMELVALSGLGLGFALGIVPAGQVFAGFASPAVITVIEILLIVQVLSRTSLLDAVADRIVRWRSGPVALLAMLCVTTAAISIFMNNIGALALTIPIAYSVCRVTGLDTRSVLMPMSFAALLGGLCSIIGTPANLLISHQLEDATGRGFAFFDYAWAGVPAMMAGLAAIIWWSPRSLGLASPDPDAQRPPRRIVTELLVAPGGAFDGAAMGSVGARLHGVRRDGKRVFPLRADTALAGGDVLLMETDWNSARALLAAGTVTAPAGARAEADHVAAVVMPESTVVGSRVGTVEALRARGVAVLAISPQTPRIEGDLGDLQLSIGDVLYLAGDPAAITEALDETEMLSLSRAEPGAPKIDARLPLAVFGAGIAIAATELAPPEIAFGLVVLALAATGLMNLRTGLADLNWPILIMLAAMIPLGAAVQDTGVAALLANTVVSAMPAGSPFALLATVLVLTVVLTPFVNNATTAIVLGPISIGIAQAAGLPPEPFLMAVSVGASIDFLTPFGHHNNMVAMGLGNYRFIDFPRVGWPVTLAAILAGTAAIWAFWM